MWFPVHPVLIFIVVHTTVTVWLVLSAGRRGGAVGVVTGLISGLWLAGEIACLIGVLLMQH
jgi:hypothetical protein